MAKRPRTKEQPAPTAATLMPEVFKEATGTDKPFLQQRLVNQVCLTLWAPEGLEQDDKLAWIASAIALLQGIKPADDIEGMLAAQMVGTHYAAMECLRRAVIGGQTFEGRDQNLKHASKLLSIFSRQIEVLDKHRGKGQQKMTVEHVHVAAGGQAMVGHIETEMTAGARRTGAKPETKAIPNDPGETIDIELELKHVGAEQKILRPEIGRKP